MNSNNCHLTLIKQCYAGGVIAVMAAQRPTYQVTGARATVYQNRSIISDVPLSKHRRFMNLNKYPFSYFSPCLTEYKQTVLFNRVALQNMFSSLKHNSGSYSSIL